MFSTIDEIIDAAMHHSRRTGRQPWFQNRGSTRLLGMKAYDTVYHGYFFIMIHRDPSGIVWFDACHCSPEGDIKTIDNHTRHPNRLAAKRAIDDYAQCHPHDLAFMAISPYS